MGGIKQYVEWSRTARRHQDFFTDDLAMKYFEDTFTTLATRVNTINGIAYKDDATIMAWNLANEARCQRCKSSVMQTWIERMCAKLKTVAPNHLVGIGYEGFYGGAEVEMFYLYFIFSLHFLLFACHGVVSSILFHEPHTLSTALHSC